MKICFLANIKDNHSRRWIKYFAEKGHQVYCISSVPDDVEDLPNVNFYFLKKYSCKVLDIALNIGLVRRLLREVNPDVLHAQYIGVTGALGALSGFHPLVLTAFGSDILIAPQSKIVRSLIRFSLKRADLITCSAKHIKKAITELGIDSLRIKLVHFGIDTRKFSYIFKNKKLIQELGLQNFPVVVSIRNLEPIYDVKTLIRAVPFVLEKLPDIKFIIAGDGSEKEKLGKIAKSLGVLKNIRFVGWLSEKQIPDYLKLGDVYVSTSLSDGSSMSLAEAMASGVFPVVTRIPANKEWIKDGVNGFFCETGNHLQLAKRILKALSVPDDIKKEVIRKNQKLVKEKEDWQRNMELMEKYYFQLTNQYAK